MVKGVKGMIGNSEIVLRNATLIPDQKAQHSVLIPAADPSMQRIGLACKDYFPISRPVLNHAPGTN